MIGQDPAATERYLVPGLVALGIGIVATWGVRSFARRHGIVNKPNPIVPQHTRPVAYLGGVGLGVGAAGGLVAMYLIDRADLAAMGVSLGALCVPALLYLALGVYDDLVALPPARKFVFQACLALLAVVLGAWSPFTGVGLVDRVFSWFWIVTLVNAFNLTDVCDGLVGSLSAVMFGIIGLAYPPLGPVCVVLVAACCGFLVFNKPPATIFMGDAGSHLLGYLAATLTLAGIGSARLGPLSGTLAAVLLVGVPLFELAFLVIVRTRKGLAWWRGSPDHFSLRLQAGGMNRWQTDFIACAAAAAMGGAALGLPRVHVVGHLVVAGAALALGVMAGRILLRWEVKRPVPVSVVPGPPGAEAPHAG